MFFYELLCVSPLPITNGSFGHSIMQYSCPISLQGWETQTGSVAGSCVCVCALTRLMCIICRLNLRLVQIHRLGFLEEAPDSKSMEACLRSDLPRHRPGAGGFRYLADVAWQYEVDDTTVCRIGQTLEQEAAAFAVQLEVKLITPGDSR